jgi:hypothetical protein
LIQGANEAVLEAARPLIDSASHRSTPLRAVRLFALFDSASRCLIPLRADRLGFALIDSASR